MRVAWRKVLATREMMRWSVVRSERESKRRLGRESRARIPYRISSTPYLAVASSLVFALYCFVAGVDACPIHHVWPLRESVKVP